ncbi:hypothetical protein ETB97_009335, partial [Aspergillus alliaceus]
GAVPKPRWWSELLELNLIFKGLPGPAPGTWPANKISPLVDRRANLAEGHPDRSDPLPREVPRVLDTCVPGFGPGTV